MYSYGRYPQVTIVQDEQAILTITPQDMSEATPLLSEVSYHHHHAKKRSALLYLFVIQMLFILLAVIGASFKNERITTQEALVLLTVPIGQIAWAAGVHHLGRTYQYFARDDFLRAFPMLWLPLFPLFLQQIMFQLTLPSEILYNVLESVRTTVIPLQGLRVLAVGSLIKWNMGLFPTAFAWGTAFPDMMYGCSAWWILYMQSTANTNDKSPFFTQEPLFLLIWHLIGFIVLVPVGILIVQFGMAPTALYRSRHSYRLVFEHPMVLGPAVVVPIFLSWNLLMVFHEFEKL